MKRGGVLLLAGYTARSKAYAQAMEAAGMAIDSALLFGDASMDAAPANARSGGPRYKGNLFLPDLSKPVRATCDCFVADVVESPSRNVNSPDIVERLAAANPSLIVYSGYGGQLVGNAILDLNIPVLHLHAGWLPEYRGSTTIYYSWIREGFCAVTAILLNSKIDEGNIVARRRYPPPPPEIDVDRVYDNALRANLLVEVLADYRRTGSIDGVPQRLDAGEIYYVIHPILKHIALLSDGDR